MICSFLHAREGGDQLYQFPAPPPFNLFFSGRGCLEAAAVYATVMILVLQVGQQEANHLSIVSFMIKRRCKPLAPRQGALHRKCLAPYKEKGSGCYTGEFRYQKGHC